MAFDEKERSPPCGHARLRTSPYKLFTLFTCRLWRNFLHVGCGGMHRPRPSSGFEVEDSELMPFCIERRKLVERGAFSFGALGLMCRIKVPAPLIERGEKIGSTGRIQVAVPLKVACTLFRFAAFHEGRHPTTNLRTRSVETNRCCSHSRFPLEICISRVWFTLYGC